MTYAPRWYQSEAIQAPFSYWDRDNLPPLASPCIEVPTGGGKSAIIGWTTQRLVQEYGARVIVATHRGELIEQDAADMREVWPVAPIGIYSAGLGLKQAHRDVVICGVQSASRKQAIQALGHRDVMIIDEAHLVNSEEGTQYARLIAGLRDINPDMRLIGYTATPFRMGQGYLTSGDSALFNSICYRVSVRKLIDEGFLSPLVTGSPSVKIDLSEISIKAGEYEKRDLELACNVDDVTEHVAQDVVDALKAGRRKGLLYGVSVAHAAMMRNALQMHGVATEMIDGSMDRAQRRVIYQAFRAGELQCLTSCDVLTTGFNVPDVDVVALVRPTQSTGLYVQILGRGMRTAPGKADCLVLDYGANIARHGPVDNVRVRGTPQGKGDGDAPVKVCPDCYACLPISSRECEHCGHEFPAPERKANRAASNLPALTNKNTPKPRSTHAVGEVMVWRHQKKGGEGLPTVRIDYIGPSEGSDIGDKVASEWLCVEHEPGSFPHRKWADWWRDNVGTYLPETVDEAVTRLRSGEFPRVIKIDLEPDGEWSRVVKLYQERPREPGDETPEPTAPAIGFTDDDDLPF